MSARPRKLVLAVIDGLKPAMLERAVATGRAPALARIMAEGAYTDACVAAFPSVTPVCAASIATGTAPDAHRIPSMNWFLREEGRYVEYGSSFAASRQFGVVRSLTDTVYNLNAEHLSDEIPTVFEALDDAGLRTAGTTYLIYRGRFRHEVAQETALSRLVTSTLFREGVMGPRELFYADLFASRPTGCRSQLGLPGVRDQHAGCVGAYLVEHDLFDFLLLSLPDNDTHSHKNGPYAQVASIAVADRQLERLMHAAGGPDAFLAEHAVIVMADHSHAKVEATLPLAEVFGERAILPAAAGAGRRQTAASAAAEIALCPAQRSGMVYVLDEERRPALVPALIATARAVDGVGLVAHRVGEDEGVVLTDEGELRFGPGGDLQDDAGARWWVEGERDVLDLVVGDGQVRSHAYPDGLGRLWAALSCSTAGDVLLSAAPGWEFHDWGGADHIGGGSHGSLHRSDSLGALLWCGTGPADAAARAQWSLRDIVPMILEHFGVQDP